MSMQECAVVKYEVKKSRFYAHLYEIDDPSDLDGILASHGKEYRNAAHHCAAVRFLDGAVPVESFKNDREVGHPGKALLEVLKKYSLDRHVLVVSRVFGGIKLGPGGVTRAFRDAGEGAAARYARR